MLRELWENTLFAGRISIILLALLALIGTGAAAQIFSAYHPDDQGNGSKFHHASLTPAVSSEDASEGMATKGRPVTGQAACFLIPLHLPSNGTETRFRDRESSGFCLPGSCFLDRPNSDLCGSPSRVSSVLGRQQTLVGAKPSGTS